MGDTEKKERPKRVVKKTAVVTDNVELDKLFKKVTGKTGNETDKEAAVASKREEKARERELSKERKKAAEDLGRLAALKKVADREAKKAEKEKKDKEKKEKEKAAKEKIEKESKEKVLKDKEQKEKAPKKTEAKNIPRPSPKSKKPKSFMSDTAEDETKTKPIPKPSPLSKKPKGYKEEQEHQDTDAEKLAKTSRKLTFDDESSEHIDNVSEMDESTSMAVPISQEMVAPVSSEDDSNENTEDDNPQPGKFKEVKETLLKASQDIEAKSLTSETSKTQTFTSIEEVDKVLHAANKAKAEMLTENMTQKLNNYDDKLSELRKKSDNHLDIDQLQTQVTQLRNQMQTKIQDETSTEEVLSHMSTMAESTQDIENELQRLKDKLRLEITKKDKRIEENANYLTNSFKKYVRTSEQYDKQDLDVLDRDLKKEFRTYLSAEEDIKEKVQEKTVFQEEIEPFKKSAMVSVKLFFARLLPELAPFADDALQHAMKSYNFRKERLEEELKKKRLAEEKRPKKKVTFDDPKEVEAKKKYVDDVINVYENLESWKDRVYDDMFSKPNEPNKPNETNNTGAPFLLEKYHLYKKKLTESCGSENTLEAKVRELEKITVDIENLQKACTRIEENANYLTNSFKKYVRTSEQYDKQDLDVLDRDLKNEFRKYLSAEEDINEKTQEKTVFEEKIEPFQKSTKVTLLQILAKIIPELAPIANDALQNAMKSYNFRKERMEEELKKRKLAEEKSQNKKATLEEKKDANLRKNFLNDVVTVYEDLEAWKSGVFDNMCNDLNDKDATFMSNKYETYKLKLTDNCKSDATLEEKAAVLTKVKKDIEELTKASKSFIKEFIAKHQKVTSDDVCFLTEEEIEEFAQEMAETTISALMHTEQYDNENLDDLQKELATNFVHYIGAEEDLKKKGNPDKRAMAYERKQFEKNNMNFLLESIKKDFPQFSDVADSALKQAMTWYNNEKKNMQEDNSQRRKAEAQGNVATETRNIFVQEVIKSTDNLKRWKETFYDMNRQHFSPEDIANIDEKLQSYNNLLSGFLESNAEMEEKIDGLSKVNVEIQYLQRVSKSQLEEKTSQPKKVSIQKCYDEIKLFKDWQKDFFSTRLANLTVAQQEELNREVTTVIMAGEESFKDLLNNKKVTKFEAAQLLQKLQDCRLELQLDFQSKNLQTKHLQTTMEKYTLVCINNAMNHLKYEHDLKDENSVSVHTAVDEYFRLKLLPANEDNRTEKDKESLHRKIGRASMKLTQVLKDNFGGSGTKIFNDVQVYLDPTKPYITRAQVVEDELQGMKEQITEECRLLAEWRDERWEKYRDQPELIPTTDFEDRLKKTTRTIQYMQELMEKTTVDDLEHLKNKWNTFKNTRKTCELSLKNWEKKMEDEKSLKEVKIREAKLDELFKALPTKGKIDDATKMKKNLAEGSFTITEKHSSPKVQSPTRSKSSSSSSSSPVSRPQTPTPTPNLELHDEALDLERVYSQEDIDFATVGFSPQINKELETHVELEDIDMGLFENFTQEEAKQADMAAVEMSPSRNVTQGSTPELATTQELVANQSKDIAKSSTRKGKEGIANKVSMYLGDITKLDVDAIVNAANEKLLGGGGIDAAIHKAAGPKLLEKCRTLKGCKPGQAKITPGFNLPAKTIIHAVGPRDMNQETLKSAYESSMQLMTVHNMKTIAFPCISTGIFGYPPEKAASVAITTVTDFLERNPNHIEHVTFCLYSPQDVAIYKNEMEKIFPGETITFVDEKNNKDSDLHVKDLEDKKRDRSPSTESDDAYVKLSRKRKAAAKKTRREMIAGLLKPVPKEKKGEEVGVSEATQTLRKKLKELAHPKKLGHLSKRVEHLKSLLKSNKDTEETESKKDLTPDSSDHDKTWKAPKKDPPGSSDEFKYELKSGKKKVFTKTKSTPKKGTSTKEDKEGRKHTDEKKETLKRRRPNVIRKDFEALGFQLASPTTVTKEKYLTWAEALAIVRDKDMIHATKDSYFEPKGNEVYKITGVLNRAEDVNTFSHRDNFFSAAYGGPVKHEDKKRYTYMTKTLEGNWNKDHFVKYIFTFPRHDCMILQYVGDPTMVQQKSEAVEPPAKKGKKNVTSSDDDVHPPTKTSKKGPRLNMLDPSDYEVTDADAGEEEDSVDEAELQKEWEKRKEESERRKLEKQNNNLAQFLRTVIEEKKYESSQHVPHIPMKKKREAVEAFVLEDEDQGITNKQLDAVIAEALRIGEGIENGNETYISIPEGGKVYLFDCRKTQQPWNKMLLNDGFRYKLKNHYYLPNSNFDKSKFYGYTSYSEGKRMEPTATFKKYTYFNTQSGILAIHYRGNVEDVSRVPHGNASRSKQLFIPTSKGLEKDINEDYKGISGHKTYHDLTSKLPGSVASTIVGPRNARAVHYIRQKLEHKSWVDNLDEVKKVALVSDYLGDFVRGSTTKPYFAAVLATETGLTEFRRVIDKMPKNTPLETYYDTTFEFGNQYASIYSYRHPFLERVNKKALSRSDMPIVPLFVMLHEKKFQESHQFMFRTAEETFDKKYSHAKKTFKNTPKVMISDKEFDGEKLLSNCKTIHCWNHLKKNISSEAKYKKHVRGNELQHIEDDFDKLVVTETEAEYTTMRDTMLAKRHWRNTGMAEYFMDRIDQDFKNNSARWVLDEWGIGHGRFGITNNPAETVNSVIHTTKNDEELKKIHKNYTVPDTMLFFHHYAQCNDKELRSAYHNASTDFQVRQEYKKRFEKELKLMPPVYIQDVAEMKEEMKERLDPEHEPTEEETPDKVEPPKASEPDAFKKLAEQHIKENRLCRVPELRSYFGVRDMARDNMVWVDYMVDKCTCPIGNKGQCPHKLAVQIKYNLPVPPVRVRNAAIDKSLAYNPTSKFRPKYGKKKPTTDDTHDVAAHGMKKEKASEVKKMMKEVKDDFDVAAGKMISSEEEVMEDGTVVTVHRHAPKVADPKKVFLCDSFDMTSLHQDLTVEEATVMPYKAKVFSVKSKEKFAIYSPETNHAVLLFHEKDKASLETTHSMTLAALSARRGATFSLHKHNKPMVAVSYRVVKDNVDLKTAAAELHKRGNWKQAGDVHLELACYCRMPLTIDDDKNNLAKCSNCSSHYHKTCLPAEENTTLEDSGKKWKCKSCTIPRNIEWGHLDVFRNTCPVDPMFQTVYLAISDDKELMNHFPDDEAHQTLKKSMLAIEEGNCFEAHGLWYDVVLKTNPEALRETREADTEGGDFWGGHNSIAWETLQAGKQFQRILQCNNDSCTRQITYQDKTNSMFIRASEGSARDQIDHLLAERSSKKCIQCHTGRVEGGKVSFSSNEKVWFVEFIGSGHHAEQDGIHNDLDLKEVIHIPDHEGIEHEFKLKAITYSQNARKHFVSIHRVDGQYIFADPIMERTSSDDTDTKKAKKNFPLRYRAPLPSDHDYFGANKACIVSIIYVRQF